MPVSDAEVDQYLETVIWADLSDDPLGRRFNIADFSDHARSQAEDELERFKNEASRVIAILKREGETPGMSRWPIDFWLTRNGHGAGFWDRPELYGEAGAEAFTALSHAAGECYVYVADGGELEFQ